jgi:ATP-dependent helicase HrpA
VVAEHRELKTQVKWMPQIEKIRLFAAPLCKTKSIDDQLIDLVAVRAFYGADGVPRDFESFEAQRHIGRRNIAPTVQDVAKLILPLFAAYQEARLALEQPRPAACQPALDDIRGQLAALLPDGFLVATPWDWLNHIPRYLKAITLRLKKLTSGGLDRDRQQLALLIPRQRALQDFEANWTQLSDSQLIQYRWMLEELRVSLFAQELGTSLSVSPERLERFWRGEVRPLNEFAMDQR